MSCYCYVLHLVNIALYIYTIQTHKLYGRRKIESIERAKEIAHNINISEQQFGLNHGQRLICVNNLAQGHCKMNECIKARKNINTEQHNIRNSAS